MLKNKLKISTSLVLLVTVTGLSGCSAWSQAGKTARNLTNFGGNTPSDLDNTLIIPPSLKIPVANSDPSVAVGKPRRVVKPVTAAAPARKTAQVRRPTQVRKPTQARRPANAQRTASRPANFYIIVGTYPDQLDALDTFTRISSIGLKGATMESRKTKAGNALHMVRLGPYSKQEEIDQAKDRLTNTGLSQFKIVKN